MESKKKNDVAALLEYGGAANGSLSLGWPCRRCRCF